MPLLCLPPCFDLRSGNEMKAEQKSAPYCTSVSDHIYLHVTPWQLRPAQVAELISHSYKCKGDAGKEFQWGALDFVICFQG